MTRFDDDRYVARRDVTFFRPRVYLYDTGGSVVSVARADITGLRRRITVYSDIALTSPILIIMGQEVVGCTMRYDVTDTESHNTLGSVRRSGFLSTDRTRWRLFDIDEREIARIHLASAPSPLSSALKGIFPRTWEVVGAGQDRVAARFWEKWIAAGITVDVEFSPVGAHLLDRRLVAAGLMLLLYVR